MIARLPRRFWYLLIALAVTARLCVPDGWMPAAGAAGGFTIVMCDGTGPARPLVMTIGPDGRMVHQPAKPGKTPAMPAGQPCAFAGIGLAAAPPAPPSVAAPPPVPAVPVAQPLVAAAIGRGLAAPPPPATGPPAFA